MTVELAAACRGPEASQFPGLNRWPTPSVPAIGLIHVALPLALGFAVYLLWRPTTLWMFVWLDWLGVLPFVYAVRTPVGVVAPALPSAVLYSVPAACWSYAFASTVAVIWRTAPLRQWVGAMLFSALVGMVGEVAQLMPWVPGVYDSNDALANLLACGFATAVAWHGRRRVS